MIGNRLEELHIIIQLKNCIIPFISRLRKRHFKNAFNYKVPICRRCNFYDDPKTL